MRWSFCAAWNESAFDAETAERWGWFNRVLPVDQIDTFVQNLAHRIALMDPEAIALTKGPVDYGDQALRDGLTEESGGYRCVANAGLSSSRAGTSRGLRG